MYLMPEVVSTDRNMKHVLMSLIIFVVVDGIDLSNLLSLRGIEPGFLGHPAHSLVTVLNMLFVYCQKLCTTSVKNCI
jgi:hypothetical protein